jgi:hypothetical protein
MAWPEAKRRRRMLTAALAVLALGAAAFAVMAVKDRTYVGSPAYAPKSEPNRNVAVVYYSRSGHSEAVAREIARIFNSAIARIETSRPVAYAGGTTERRLVADRLRTFLTT